MLLSGNLRGADTPGDLDRLLAQLDAADRSPAGELSARLGIAEDRAGELCWIHPEPRAEYFVSIAGVDPADVDTEWVQALINAERRRRELRIYPELATEYR